MTSGRPLLADSSMSYESLMPLVNHGDNFNAPIYSCGGIVGGRGNNIIINNYQAANKTEPVARTGVDLLTPSDISLLDNLPRAKDARWDYVDLVACLPGTRTEELNNLWNWMNNEMERRLYLLSGLAGTGKTTIAKSVAQLAQGNGILGASFFCSRDSDSRSDIRLIFPTIAFHLSQFFPEFRAAVIASIRQEPDIGHSLPDRQLEQLIVKPLNSVITSIVTSFRDDLGFGQSIPDEQAETLILTPLQRIMASIKKQLTISHLLYDEPQKIILGPLRSLITKTLDSHLMLDTQYQDLILMPLYQVIDSLEKGNLPRYKLLEELIAEPIRSVIASIVTSFEGKPGFDEIEELFVKPLERINQAVEDQALSRFLVPDTQGKMIADPLRAVIESIETSLNCRGNLLPEEQFKESVLKPMERVVALVERSPNIARSSQDEQFQEWTMKSMIGIITSLQEKLDVGSLLPYIQLKTFILDPLRKIIQAIENPIEPLSGGKALEGVQRIITYLLTPRRLKYKQSDVDKELIVKFLRRFRPFSRPVVIVLDALDECKDEKTPENITLALSKHMCSVPYLKVFLTSRPEFSIRCALQDPFLNPLKEVLILHDVARTRVDDDIRLFLNLRLDEIAKRRRRDNFTLPAPWPPNSLIDKLVVKASGLFIFASTICKFIEAPGDHQEQLEDIADLQTSSAEGHLGINDLYQKVIDTATARFADRRLIPRCLSIVRTIVLLFNPLPLAELARVLNVKPNLIRGVLRDLHSVLVVPPYDEGVIRTIHASFHDFLMDRDRCSDRIYMQPAKQHEEITRSLFTLMQDLKRNICKIDEFKLNKEVDDLDERKDKYINKSLAYACRYWAEHLSLVSPTECDAKRVVRALDELMRSKFLFWIEALSLLGSIEGGVMAIRKARDWLSHLPQTEPELDQLLHDAHRLVVEFSGPISVAALQIYFSALPFTYPDNILFKTYQHELQSSVKVLNGGSMTWGSCLKMMEVQSSAMWTVKFSPDSAHFVSESSDGEVGLWDSTTGVYMAKLEGRLATAQFSPDSTRIISESRGCEILRWNLITEAHIAQIEGRSWSARFTPSGVRFITKSLCNQMLLHDSSSGSCIAELHGSPDSIQFSPDGSRIISTNRAGKLLLWDSITGTPIVEFEGQPQSVKFSPSGACFISKSYIFEVLLWDSIAGAQIARLEGHFGSVEFSPDSTRMITVSDHHEMLLWDSIKGSYITKLDGYSWSVRFSQDGSRIITNSSEDKLLLWNSITGMCIAKLECHAGLVQLSPDGTRIISESLVNKMLLCDSETGAHLATIVNPSWSVKFSPNGVRFTSDSNTGGVSLWDATIGCQIALLEGHPGAVDYSPHSKRIITKSCSGSALLWDSTTGKFIAKLKGHSWSFGFSPDSTRICSEYFDDEVLLWDSDNGTCIAVLEGCSRSVKFSPDSEHIMTKSWDGNLLLWDSATGALINSFEIYSDKVQFSPSGKRIVLCSDRGGVQLLDSTTGATVAVLKRDVGKVILKNDWVVEPAGDRLKWICWLPVACRGHLSIWASDANCFILENNSGRLTILDLSNLQ